MELAHEIQSQMVKIVSYLQLYILTPPNQSEQNINRKLKTAGRIILPGNNEYAVEVYNKWHCKSQGPPETVSE